MDFRSYVYPVLYLHLDRGILNNVFKLSVKWTRRKIEENKHLINAHVIVVPPYPWGICSKTSSG